MKKIAVIGSGISGLSTAWALHDVADVTVFEANDRVGGHAYTVDVNFNGQTVPVDVGFIVCNPLNYPNFMAFMEALDVNTVQSDMSFAVSDPNGYEWSSNRDGLFAYKRNLLNFGYIRFLLDILKFNKRAQTDIAANAIAPDLTLGSYLDQIGMSDKFRRNYILPMGAAIWSTPEADMDAYPALSFLNFFNNHKLLHMDRPAWRTVENGSRTYVQRLVEILGDRLKTGSQVECVERCDDKVAVTIAGERQLFDDVVLSCSAPISTSLLGQGLDAQKAALSDCQTVSNKAVLHSDPSLMPRRKNAWASWNVLKGQTDKVTLSYWMNKLQNIDDATPLFVTLNPEFSPAKHLTHGEFDFEHPLFNMASQTAVEHIHQLNGKDNVWFAGAWLGHGFHEDGLKSGLRVARSLGAILSWEGVDVEPYPMRPTHQTTLDTSAPMVAAE